MKIAFQTRNKKRNSSIFQPTHRFMCHRPPFPTIFIRQKSCMFIKHFGSSLWVILKNENSSGQKVNSTLALIKLRFFGLKFQNDSKLYIRKSIVLSVLGRKSYSKAFAAAKNVWKLLFFRCMDSDKANLMCNLSKGATITCLY